MMGIETNTNDEIILVKSPLVIENGRSHSDLSFQKTIDLINLSDNVQNKKLSNIDKFGMPMIDFDFTREITELLKKKFLNEDLTKMELSKIVESLKLFVNESGVKVEN